MSGNIRLVWNLQANGLETVSSGEGNTPDFEAVHVSQAGQSEYRRSLPTVIDSCQDQSELLLGFLAGMTKRGDLHFSSNIWSGECWSLLVVVSPKSVAAQYATGEEQINNSRKNEEAEPK